MQYKILYLTEDYYIRPNLKALNIGVITLVLPFTVYIYTELVSNIYLFKLYIYNHYI